MSIKSFLIRNILVPSLVVSMSFIGCGGGGGNTGQSTASSQNDSSEQLTNTISELISDFDKINDEFGDITVFDENSGNKVLNYFKDKAVPQLDEALADLQQLQADETALVNFITTNGGTVAFTLDEDSPDLQAGIVLQILGAAAILTAMALPLLNFGLNTKARVKRIEDGIQKSIDSGKSPAEAWNENSGTMKKEFDEHRLDLSIFIAENNEGTGFIKSALSKTGRILVEMKDAVGNLIDIKKNSHLVGAKKDNTSNLVKSQSTNLSPIYMGAAGDNNFSNVPVGLWDFVVFQDGYIRGVMENVTISEGSNFQSVVMHSLDELDDATEDDDNTGSGSFSIDGFSNIDGTIGSNGADADIQLSGSGSFPTISWPFGQAATLLVSTAGTGSTIYGIVSGQDENDNLIPLQSPVTYGNYNIADAVPFGAASNPSPALSVGQQYLITMSTITGGTASLIFTVN